MTLDDWDVKLTNAHWISTDGKQPARQLNEVRGNEAYEGRAEQSVESAPAVHGAGSLTEFR